MKYTGRGFYDRHGRESGDAIDTARLLVEAFWTAPPHDENLYANKHQFTPSRCTCGSKRFKRDQDRNLWRCLDCARPWLGEQENMRLGAAARKRRRQS